MTNVYYCVHCGCSLYLHVSAYPAITQNPAACPGLVLLKIPAVSPCLLLLVHVRFPFLSHPSQPLQSIRKQQNRLQYQHNGRRNLPRK